MYSILVRFVSLLLIYQTAKVFCQTDAKVCFCSRNNTLQCRDYIPYNISVDVKHVVLTGFTRSVNLSALSFGGENWPSIRSLQINMYNISIGAEIKRLTIERHCFENLHGLKELRIFAEHINLDQEVFWGLNNLRVLDLTNTTYLGRDQLFSNLRSQHGIILARLEEMVLVRTGNYMKYGIPLNDSFWNFIGNRPVKRLNISYLRISTFFFKPFYNHCSGLEELIAIGTRFPRTAGFINNSIVCSNLRILDISGSTLPKLDICFKSSLNIEGAQQVPLDTLSAFSQLTHLKLDNLCPASNLKYQVYNDIGVSFYSSVPWNLKSLSLKQNNLKVLDVKLICDNAILEHLDLSQNGMEFINPGLLSCLTSLQHLDLSINNLAAMARQHTTPFGNLFLALYNLRVISLSSNSLKTVPNHIFKNNKQLVKLDLSANTFDYITFNVRVLDQLEFLDLSKNNLHFLGETCRANLNSLLIRSRVKINLSRNPFSCSNCKDYNMVSWLLNNQEQLGSFYKGLTCFTKEERNTAITKDVENDLHYMCERPYLVRKTITIAATLASVCILSTIIASIYIKRYSTRRCKLKKRQDLITLLQNNEREFPFLVFLSFSSEDETLVNKNITEALQKSLQEITDVNRNLVCIGDSEFRLGQPIHEEIIYWLLKSRVILVVLSESFCRSRCCTMEFEQACKFEKPVVFMVIDTISEDILPPVMKVLYNSNTRVHWHEENNKLVMKTSWKNVAESVLELAVDK